MHFFTFQVLAAFFVLPVFLLFLYLGNLPTMCIVYQHLILKKEFFCPIWITFICKNSFEEGIYFLLLLKKYLDYWVKVFQNLKIVGPS